MERARRLVVSVEPEIGDETTLRERVERAGVDPSSIGRVRLTPLKVGWLEVGDITPDQIEGIRRQPGIVAADLERRFDVPRVIGED